MRPINCLLTQILQNMLFCVQQEINSGLEQLESEKNDERNFISLGELSL